MDTSLKVTISLNDAMSGALNKIKGNLNDLGKKFEMTEKQGIKATDKMFDGFNERVIPIVKRAAAAVTIATGAIVGFGTRASLELERTRVYLDVLTGSTEIGAKTYRDLVEFAKKTPFETSHLVKATQLMLSYNVPIEQVQTNLRQLGDIALGDSVKLGHLTLAFGQMSAQGKLMGQDLNQMVQAGFNPLQEIAKTTGETMGSLKDRMAKGKISIEEVQNALKTATEEGGRFYQGMERGSETVGGRLSTLKDELVFATAGVLGLSDEGKILEGTFLDLLKNGINVLIEKLQAIDWASYADDIGDAIKTIIENIENLTKFYQDHEVAVNAVAIAITAFSTSLYTLIAVTKGLAAIKTAFAAFSAAGLLSFGLVAIAIAAIAVGAYLIYENWEWISTKAKEIWGSVSETVTKAWDDIKKKWNETKDNILQGAQDTKDKVSKFFTDIKDSIVKKFTETKDEITRIWNAITTFITNRVNDITWVFNNIPESAGIAFGYLIGIAADVMGAVARFVYHRIEDIKRFFVAIPGFISGVWTSITTFWNNGMEWIKNKSNDIINGIIGFFLNLPGNIVNIWTQIRDGFNHRIGQLHNAAINGINWIVDRFREIPGRVAEFWVWLRDGFNSRIGKLHDAVVGGLRWIVDRFRELPGQALNALSGMFNVGKDAMSWFWNGLLSNMGKFGDGIKEGLRRQGMKGIASGTNFTFGGQYLVGETGPELVTLPRGAQVTRASETNDMMKGQTINISINNPTVRNDNDINMIVEQVTKALNSTQRLKRLGV